MVTYKTGFVDWIYCTLCIHTVRDYRQYSATAILLTFQFTFAHTLGFSVITSRILATGISQSQCSFKSHVKSSCHNLIPFLSLFCSCQFRRLDSTAVPYSLPLCFYYSCPVERFLQPLCADHTENTVKNACLLVRYLAMDVLFSCAPVLRECVYRPIA
jgi:hypothetical protein